MADIKMKHISTGNDGSIWAADKTNSTIYRLFGDAGMVGWIRDKIGKAEVIAAVDFGNIWCVNNKHEIWKLTDAENIDAGGTWTQVQTHSGKPDARTISVGKDGSVWYAALDGSIYRLTGDADAIGWLTDGIGKAVDIAAVDFGSLWCVNDKHEIWFLENATILTEGKWTQVKTHSGKPDARSIAVGYDGVFYLQTDGTIIQTVPPGVGTNIGYWRKYSTQFKAEVVAVEPRGGFWCLTSAGDPWTLVNGKLEQFFEKGPNYWTYRVKQGDGLTKIVISEFKLKAPQDNKEINRLVDLIVKQNSGITRDLIYAGSILKLNY